MKFFNPTGLLKELQLLEHIEENPRTTQKAMSGVIDGAVSMVNVYIDNLEKEGYLNRNYKSLKDVEYIITPSGIKRKNYLYISYFNELIYLYQLAENNIESFLMNLEKKGYKKILMYGAGEVSKSILGVIERRDNGKLNILALIDDNEMKKNKELLGYKIISKDDIEKYNHDGILITSYTFEEQILKKLDYMGYQKDKVIKFFSD